MMLAALRSQRSSSAAYVFATLACLAVSSAASPLLAQSMAPQYSECRLDAIYPNGGQRGSTVTVQLFGVGHGISNPTELIIDGPPGITVKQLQSKSVRTAQAILEIAPDAPLGRRWLRVASERAGLTNFAYFVVSGLREELEQEPNSTLAQAQRVATLPAVLNGRIDPAADIDVYRFTGRAGQKLAAAISAHALDVHGQYKHYGIADFSLELLDAKGATLANSEDAIGFDPLLELVLPADGEYLLRVQLLNYDGFPEAVYRLTVGETPILTSIFPAGLQRGTAVDFELAGSGIAPGTRRRVDISPNAPEADRRATAGDSYPLRYLTLAGADHAGIDLPILVGEHPESLEAEPNNAPSAASLVTTPCVVNGRFDQADDADWFRVRLEGGQKIWIETHAQRFIRSPVDTHLQVYDSQGKMLGENDDEVFEPGYECYHDYKTTDSKLLFAAPATGEYLVRVSESTGAGGTRAIYRLTFETARPDFRLTHFPDAVPIWGPGSTAGVLVRIDRFAGFDDDVELLVEGLPPGWSSSGATSLGGHGIRPYNTYQFKVFLTITAPADARPGSSFPFRIVGRSKPRSAAPDSSPLVHESLPLTLFYTSDTGFFRASPRSRVAVAKPQGPWLELVTRELSLPAGQKGIVQVRVLGAGDATMMPLVVNLATAGVACALNSPQVLPIRDGLVEVPITVPAETYPGVYGVMIAQTWGSDIRVGMPGPCTPLIRLEVRPK